MADGRWLRLLHLASPSLPTGAFAYSQGLEWAVAADWIRDAADLGRWLTDLLEHAISRVDVPILVRLYRVCRADAHADLSGWCDLLLALRESFELRMEEIDRGRAMTALLEGLGVPMAAETKRILGRSQLAGFAYAAARWEIDVSRAATGYVWSWLENQVLAGIKLIPLGQTQGHGLLVELDGPVMAAVDNGLGRSDDEIGGTSPALAIAASLHETQYTRLYRS